MLNILVTAIGSMSAEAVLHSLRKNFAGSKIIGTDIHKKEWLYLSDKVDHFYKVRKADDPLFIDQILEICSKHSINYILPLTDPEVDALSESHDRFREESVVLALSEHKTIKLCRSKEKFADRLKDSSIVNLIPSFTVSDQEMMNVEFPVVAKPKEGRSSEGLKFINSTEKLSKVSDDYILQKHIDGPIITVDFVRDFASNFVSIPRKELIRSSNGAGLSVKVFQDKEIEHLVTTIAEILEIRGCMNVEFIYNSGKYYLMDINPRFSAGVGFNKFAGYDFVKNHMNVFMNRLIDPLGAISEYTIVRHFKDYLKTV